MKLRHFFSLFTFLLGISSIANAQSSLHIFDIHRSINLNYVRYDLKLTSDGKIDADQPVDGYWIMAAEDGRREEISWLERKAYGYSVASPSDSSLTLNLKALPGKPLSLTVAKNQVVPGVEISNRSAILTEVFVQVSHSIFPGVDFIRVDGTDSVTGASLEEIVRP